MHIVFNNIIVHKIVQVTNRKIANKKKISFLKKILSVIFPIECFKYFSSQPIKKITCGLKNKYNNKPQPEESKNSAEKPNPETEQKSTLDQDINNPFPRFESLRKRKKYQILAIRSSMKVNIFFQTKKRKWTEAISS